MDNLLAIAASGLRSRMESLELLANNLANASTRGYKADRELYGLYWSQAAATMNDADPAVMPLIERNWVDFQQGTLQHTGNPLDVGLEGKGFLAVNSPEGVLYTRNGALALNAQGVLVAENGYPVRGANGAPISLTPDKPFTVQKDGKVEQDGAIRGRLELAVFPDPGVLAKQGNSYFRVADDRVKPDFSVTVTVHQGRLEGSNVGTAESAVRLVNVLRQFEMLQKAVTLGGEMNRKAVEEVAKVGS